jgi:HEAT repeat protein
MGLIAIVRESPLVTDDTPLESEETSRVMAIQLLGRIRAAEAVPVLIQYVMLRTPRTWSDKLELSNIVYPAAESLARIGTPAVQPIIDGLQGDVPAAKRVVLVHILRRIEGADTAGYILDAPRKRIKDPFVQKHLGESLEILDKLSKRELILGAPATAPS